MRLDWHNLSHSWKEDQCKGKDTIFCKQNKSLFGLQKVHVCIFVTNSSPIFSVNFTNRKNSAVLNYHKSWSWSNQPVLWDFYIMFLLVSSIWMFGTIFYPKHGVTGDVWCHNILTFHEAFVENRYALVPFWSWNTLQHYLVDVMMKQKSFFEQGNLYFALMYRNNIQFSVFVLCHWVDCEIYWEYRTASHLVF